MAFVSTISSPGVDTYLYLLHRVDTPKGYFEPETKVRISRLINNPTGAEIYFKDEEGNEGMVLEKDHSFMFSYERDMKRVYSLDVTIDLCGSGFREIVCKAIKSFAEYTSVTTTTELQINNEDESSITFTHIVQINGFGMVYLDRGQSECDSVYLTTYASINEFEQRRGKINPEDFYTRKLFNRRPTLIFTERDFRMAIDDRSGVLISTDRIEEHG